MQAVAQRLTNKRIPMVEFPQSPGNLTEASSNLYKLIKGQNIIIYSDDNMRLAVQRSIAVETPRGWRIAKEKASHKIDVVVALGVRRLVPCRRACPRGRYWLPIACSHFHGCRIRTGMVVGSDSKYWWSR